MMDLDDDPEINLSIPVKPILEEISCPICLNYIKEATMTRCGHNFCLNCILECVNRNHVCPCCNKETKKDTLIKNHHLDKLIEIVVKEKEESSKIFFNSLINNGQQQLPPKPVNQPVNPDNNVDKKDKKKDISPIQDLFSKYIKSSLLSYEDFYNQLNIKYKENLVKMEEEKKNVLKQYENQELLYQQALEEHKYSLEKLETSHKTTVNLLLQSFEDHLKKVAIAPNFMNIQASIFITCKNITFEHVSIKSSSTVQDLKQVIIERLNQKGGDYQFIKFGEPYSFIVQKPLVVGGEEIVLNDENKPISLYQVPQGSKFIFRGDIVCNGDLPKECFSALKFTPGEVMDYYRCQDCSFNWICKSCIQFCHKGHNVAPYILNHKPSYACCYDQRYGKCKIVHK